HGFAWLWSSFWLLLVAAAPIGPLPLGIGFVLLRPASFGRLIAKEASVLVAPPILRSAGDVENLHVLTVAVDDVVGRIGGRPRCSQGLDAGPGALVRVHPPPVRFVGLPINRRRPVRLRIEFVELALIGHVLFQLALGPPSRGLGLGWGQAENLCHGLDDAL